ncbi:MAG: hypothetical protein U0800_16395 [Isosphaeraceae bacterium]
MPVLDATKLSLAHSIWKGDHPPILLVDAVASDDRTVRLCDFASAGFDGSTYRTWLPVANAPNTPFRREAPGRTSPASPRR